MATNTTTSCHNNSNNNNTKKYASPRNSSDKWNNINESSKGNIRRLPDEDVRSIFESLHHSKFPPPHLKFQIVPVGTNGRKITPPRYQFENGLYVLLRPQKKRQSPPDIPKAPPHLTSFLMKDTPRAGCRWTLSGPQFPQPTAIQQRYCYPQKDNPEYGGQKGAALWTMYDNTGKEDLEFRLLHVYFSAKGAVNREMNVQPNEDVTTKMNSSPHYPRSYDDNPSSPITDIDCNGPSSNPFCYSNSRYHLMTPDEESKNSLTGSNWGDGDLRQPALQDDRNSDSAVHNIMQSPLLSSKEQQPNQDIKSVVSEKNQEKQNNEENDIEIVVGNECHDNHLSIQSEDGITIMTDKVLDFEEFENDFSTWDDDPLLGTMMKPSFQENSNEQCRLKSLLSHLNLVHQRIRGTTLAAPSSEQGALLNLFASWANQASKEPLEITKDAISVNEAATTSIAPSSSSITTLTGERKEASPIQQNNTINNNTATTTSPSRTKNETCSLRIAAV